MHHQASQTTKPGQHVRDSASRRRQINNRCLKRLGISEFAIGCFSIVLSIVATMQTTQPRMYLYGYEYKFLGYPAQGIWGGIFLLSTGILASLTRPYSSEWTYVANMCMGITSALVVLATSFLSGWAAAISMDEHNNPIAALHIVVCIMNFAAMILCLIHARFCSKGARNEQRPPRQMPYVPLKVITVPQSQLIGQQGQVFVQEPMIGQQEKDFIQQPVGQQARFCIQQPRHQGHSYVPRPVVILENSPAPNTGYPTYNQIHDLGIEPTAPGVKQLDEEDKPLDYTQ